MSADPKALPLNAPRQEYEEAARYETERHHEARRRLQETPTGYASPSFHFGVVHEDAYIAMRARADGLDAAAEIVNKRIGSVEPLEENLLRGLIDEIRALIPKRPRDPWEK